jgi:hypothetical protein
VEIAAARLQQTNYHGVQVVPNEIASGKLYLFVRCLFDRIARCASDLKIDSDRKFRTPLAASKCTVARYSASSTNAPQIAYPKIRREEIKNAIKLEKYIC